MDRDVSYGSEVETKLNKIKNRKEMGPKHLGIVTALMCLCAQTTLAQDATFNGLLNKAQCTFAESSVCEDGYCSAFPKRVFPLNDLLLDIGAGSWTDFQSSGRITVTNVSPTQLNAPLSLQFEFEGQGSLNRATLNLFPSPTSGNRNGYEMNIAVVVTRSDSSAHAVAVGRCTTSY